MTDEEHSHPFSDAIDRLNGLLRGELAALNAYLRVLRSAMVGATVDAKEMLHFAAEHQRTVTGLQEAVRRMGGVPASEAGASGAFSLLRETASVRDFLNGEEARLRILQTARWTLHGDARDLVTFDLIPRQRRHIAELTAILSRPAEGWPPDAQQEER